MEAVKRTLRKTASVRYKKRKVLQERNFKFFQQETAILQTVFHYCKSLFTITFSIRSFFLLLIQITN